MSKFEKVLRRVLSGGADANIDFDDLVWLLRRLNFDLRIRGSHHIMQRSDLATPINLQPEGKQATPYQVRQVREALEELGLHEEE